MAQQQDIGRKITVPATGGQRKVVGERTPLNLPDLSKQPPLGSLAAKRPLSSRDISSNVRGGKHIGLARGRKGSR